MLKRKITQRFEEWLAAPKRKALLVSGARQTGKTFAIREFARTHFKNVIEVNFLENKAAAAFLSEANDANEFVERLSLLSNKPLSQERTLVFLDEIQEAGDAITASKFLVESNRFELAMSGSLLGVELKNVRSFPVGYLHEERMFPLDFEEFCWSQNVPDRFLSQIRQHYEEKTPLPDALHERFVNLHRQYMVVGGMPEAVQSYVDTQRDLAAVRAVHSDIVNLYKQDISKYAGKRSLFIRAIYDALPNELAKVNKRFTLQSIKNGATYENLRDDFEWLDAAGVVLKTCLVKEPKFPLDRTKENRKFKLYSADTGMLVTRYPAQTAMGILQGSRSINFGAVYENVVAQELASAGFSLRYYNNNRKGELDYLIETNSGNVIALEVKSGKDYKRHMALNNVMRTDEYGLRCAYVLSEANVSQTTREGKTLYYLPLYMLMCLGSEMPNALPSFTIDPVVFSDL